MSLCQLIYVVKYMPYNSTMDSVIEIANESTVLLVLSILLGYTDGQVDPLIGSTIGFLLVGLILLNIFVNAMLFLYAALSLIYTKFLKPLIAKIRKRCTERGKKSESAKKYDCKFG
jgi:hypothetical protein